MPPEQPPYLVILDTSFRDARLEARAEYVKPAADRLRVRWGVGSPPRGYKKEGGGVVFVADQTDSPPPPDESPPISVANGRFTYAEGLAGAQWLMLVMLLPSGFVLSDPHPAPDGSRLFADRLAVYWRLSKSPGVAEFVEVKWGLRPAGDNLGKALLTNQSGAPFPFEADEAAPEFGVFLSYRRQDDRWAVGRIRDGLIRFLGARAVFRDIDSIKLGKDYRQVIDSAVGRCRVMLAVIGPNWLDPDRPSGKRRIDSKKDWVRIEIESALQRHRLVVPLLLDETKMPDERALPDSLRELAFRQGCTLRESSFETDVQSLAEKLREHIGGIEA